MTFLKPFKAVRYDDPSPDAGDGVIDLTSVVIDHPTDPSPQGNNFSVAHLLASSGDDSNWNSWLASGHLCQDPQERLYMYRIGWRDANGVPRQACGVFGIGEMTESMTQKVIPSMVAIDNAEFSELLVPAGLPLARASLGAKHVRLWALEQPGVISLIQEATGPLPAEHVGLVAVSSDYHIAPPIGLVFDPRSAHHSDNDVKLPT